MNRNAAPQITAKAIKVSQSERFIMVRITGALSSGAGAAASRGLPSNRSSLSVAIGRLLVLMADKGAASLRPTKVGQRAISWTYLIAEQLVDRGFRAGALVDPLDDHRAG